MEIIKIQGANSCKCGLYAIYTKIHVKIFNCNLVKTRCASALKIYFPFYLTYNHPQAKYVRTAGGASDLIDKLSSTLSMA